MRELDGGSRCEHAEPMCAACVALWALPMTTPPTGPKKTPIGISGYLVTTSKDVGATYPTGPEGAMREQIARELAEEFEIALAPGWNRLYPDSPRTPLLWADIHPDAQACWLVVASRVSERIVTALTDARRELAEAQHELAKLSADNDRWRGEYEAAVNALAEAMESNMEHYEALGKAEQRARALDEEIDVLKRRVYDLTGEPQ